MFSSRPDFHKDFSRFVISAKPYCFWHPNIKKANLEFIDGIDPLYYKYVADVNRAELQGEARQYAAISTRIAYCHGLETLFSLLCACVQAPDCIAGWLSKYRMDQLRDLVETIVSQKRPILNKHNLESVTFEDTSDLINQFNLKDEDKDQRLRKSFASAWHRFAKDFLDDNIVTEYNSMKHGLRVSPGGYSLVVTPEDQAGVPDPSKAFEVGNSIFGSSFSSFEAIKNKNEVQNPRHFKFRTYALNWDPEYLLRGLYIVSLSLNNILAFLKAFNGLRDAKLCYPDDESFFEVPTDSNTMSLAATLFIDEENITPFSEDDILKVYEKREVNV